MVDIMAELMVHLKVDLVVHLMVYYDGGLQWWIGWCT